jgi:hypothetical protein
MGTVQLISISPTELANLINEGLKTHIEQLSSTLIKPQEEKEFLTRKETAKFLQISLVCLHDWMKKGIVTPYKLGNRTYFKHSQIVESLLNSNKVA